MKRIQDLLIERGINRSIPLDFCPVNAGGKNKVNILALGDVGATVLTGLRLLGGDVISSIGICDVNADNVMRLQYEINQINYPFGIEKLPPVHKVREEELFDCDVLVFCASKSVPPVGASGDVRMGQLSANREIVNYYADIAIEQGYRGMVAIVSDPVDPLCKIFWESSGLHPSQIQGYGLGVMNARALYFAERDSRFAVFEEKGRAFGPHGEELVIANDVENYDDSLSKELTELAVNANRQVRNLGFKPYIAPALSSAAISILLTLRTQWHYGSIYLGGESDGAYLGLKNRMTSRGIEYEDIPLPDQLFDRIKKAYISLCDIK